MPSINVQSSVLSQDIMDIKKKHPDTYNPEYRVSVKLHTEEKDLDHTDLVSMAGMVVVRDYTNNIADYIEVSLSIPLGTFLFDVYPYLDNIEVTLHNEKQLYKDKKPYIVTERYKAVYLAEKNSSIPVNITQSKATLNDRPPSVIVLQLLDRSSETIRIKTTQGNFHKVINPNNKDMSPKAFLKSVIAEETNKILIENNPSLDSIDIEEPSTKEEIKSLVIPSNTRIIELAEVLQNKSVGLYNAGVGSYIQRFGKDVYTFEKSLFVYSLYDPKKYKDSEYKLIFYSPIVNSHSTEGTTYTYEDKILRILPHSISNILDNKETKVMSTGSGFRTSNANSYMKKPIEITESGPVFKRNQLNTEVAFGGRKDGLNFAPRKSVSGNIFKHTSEILKNQGTYINVTVTNLDIDFIKPGHPCLINHENKEHSIDEVYGVVHQLMTTYELITPGPHFQSKQEYVKLNCTTLLNIYSLAGVKI